MMTFIVVFFYIAYLKAFYLPHLLLIKSINKVIFRNKKSINSTTEIDTFLY